MSTFSKGDTIREIETSLIYFVVGPTGNDTYSVVQKSIKHLTYEEWVNDDSDEAKHWNRNHLLRDARGEDFELA
jgi:hypothetical protein